MKVVAKLRQPQSDVSRIAHSVMAYDRTTDELGLERPMPLFLDSLALKIAGVPAQDRFGALSYPIGAKAVETLAFLLGFDVDLVQRAYFLESTVGHALGFDAQKMAALQTLAHGMTGLRHGRTAAPRLSERELVVPVLRLLDEAEGGWLSRSALILRLAALLAPPVGGPDGRSAVDFARRIGRMIADDGQAPAFIRRGLAHRACHGLRISDEGRRIMRALRS